MIEELGKGLINMTHDANLMGWLAIYLIVICFLRILRLILRYFE